MNLSPSPTKIRAFTLLETILASILFATVSVSLAVLFGVANRGTLNSLHHLSGNALASGLISSAREDARAGVVPENRSGQYIFTTFRRGNESKLAMDYRMEVHSPTLGVKDVIVEVSWEYQGKVQKIEREVLVSPRP